jgi:predicted RNase H-like nuclease
MVNASWLLALITVCCVVCLSSALRIYLLARQVRAHEAHQAHVYANQRVRGNATDSLAATGQPFVLQTASSLLL